MSAFQVGFQPLDLSNATEHEYRCVNQFKNTLLCEYLPDDPPVPLEEFIQDWKTVPAYIEFKTYAAWDPSEARVLAFCRASIFHTGDNEHIARFHIEVLPEYRRRGIARQALRLISSFASEHKRSLLLSFTWDTVAATAIFFERLGAERGSEMKMNQLRLSEFDRSLVDRWLEQSAKMKEEFDIGTLDGPYPDSSLEDVAALFQEVANDQPRDNLQLEDMNFTPQVLREWEKNMFACGDERWTIYATARADGQLVGLTEVLWNPNRPMILNQAFTGVWPAYRSRGLGRWLKAEMMQKILRERPEVQFIRTGNANSNAPMLKINQEMGFKPYVSNTIWQIKTSQVEDYLNKGANDG